MVSAALDGYLNMMGYKCHLTEGTITVDTLLEEGEMADYQHFWLTLADGRIIDPTADQFDKPGGKKMPDVYIGKLPGWYSCRNE